MVTDATLGASGQVYYSTKRRINFVVSERHPALPQSRFQQPKVEYARRTARLLNDARMKSDDFIQYQEAHQASFR